jgi:hypothetical protein
MLEFQYTLSTLGSRTITISNLTFTEILIYRRGLGLKISAVICTTYVVIIIHYKFFFCD